MLHKKGQLAEILNNLTRARATYDELRLDPKRDRTDAARLASANRPVIDDYFFRCIPAEQSAPVQANLLQAIGDYNNRFCATLTGDEKKDPKKPKLLLNVYQSKRHDLWATARVLNFFMQRDQIRCDEDSVFEIMLCACSGGLYAPKCKSLVLVGSALQNVVAPELRKLAIHVTDSNKNNLASFLQQFERLETLLLFFETSDEVSLVCRAEEIFIDSCKHVQSIEMQAARVRLINCEVVNLAAFSKTLFKTFSLQEIVVVDSVVQNADGIDFSRLPALTLFCVYDCAFAQQMEAEPVFSMVAEGMARCASFIFAQNTNVDVITKANLFAKQSERVFSVQSSCGGGRMKQGMFAQQVVVARSLMDFVDIQIEYKNIDDVARSALMSNLMALGTLTKAQMKIPTTQTNKKQQSQPNYLRYKQKIENKKKKGVDVTNMVANWPLFGGAFAGFQTSNSAILSAAFWQRLRTWDDDFKSVPGAALVKKVLVEVIGISEKYGARDIAAVNYDDDFASRSSYDIDPQLLQLLKRVRTLVNSGDFFAPYLKIRSLITGL